jgi:DNA recombination protein RmuC
MAELRSAHERLKAEFAELSATALRRTATISSSSPKQSFAQLQEKSAGDLTNRQQAIDLLVKPLKESLDKVDQKINELEQKRERAYGELGQQLESLGTAQRGCSRRRPSSRPRSAPPARRAPGGRSSCAASSNSPA